MGTEENNPDRVFLPPTSRNPDELSHQSDPAQRLQPAAPQTATAPQPQFRPPTTSGRHGVFLSYARSDGEAFANALRKRLTRICPACRYGRTAPRSKGAWAGGARSKPRWSGWGFW